MSERINVKTIVSFTTKRLLYLGLFAISITIINIIIGRTEILKGSKDIAYLIIFSGPLLSYLIWSDLSHHVSYDDERIYYRKGDYSALGRLFQGHLYHPELSMRFDDIKTVTNESNPIFRVPGRPFQYVRLYRKNWDGEEAFWFELLRYKKDSIRALVKIIHEKRPETFSKSMLDYLKADW